MITSFRIDARLSASAPALQRRNLGVDCRGSAARGRRTIEEVLDLLFQRVNFLVRANKLVAGVA
jgi:hypothetical protein